MNELEQEQLKEAITVEKEVKKLSNTGDNAVDTTGLALATTLVAGALASRRRKN